MEVRLRTCRIPLSGHPLYLDAGDGVLIPLLVDVSPTFTLVEGDHLRSLLSLEGDLLPRDDDVEHGQVGLDALHGGDSMARVIDSGNSFA